MWIAVYAALLLALFVRFRDPDAPVRVVPEPAPDEPVGLVRVHHALFYALLLVVCPLEAATPGSAEAGRLPGAVAFAAGVGLYRWSVSALGWASSPLVMPRPDAELVTTGPYRVVRHPMYLGQLLVAFGAPATLGCRWAFAVSFAAAVVLFARMRMEENALARVYADYGSYRARSKRVFPYVF
jgi:protein-S-isoprenylcysteine O-methyltransferase Ste14